MVSRPSTTLTYKGDSLVLTTYIISLLSLFKGIDFGDEGFIAKSLQNRVSTDVENNFHLC